MTVKAWAASKWYLRLVEKTWPGGPEDANFHYFDTKEGAVLSMVARENAAIAQLEREWRRAKKNLDAFIKKHGQSCHHESGGSK